MAEPVQTPEDDLPSGIPLWLRWWKFKAWFHRCPECKHRPDRHYKIEGSRWEDDKVARMLGIGRYGCRRCGHGATAERDGINRLLDALEEQTTRDEK